MSYLSPHHRPCFDLAHRTHVLNLIMPRLTRLYCEGVFDVVVGCGAGSVVMSTLVADRLGCPLAIVRKKGEPEGHACAKVIGNNFDQPHRYAFLDDLVSTGATLRHVRSELVREAPTWGFAGVFCYQSPNEGPRCEFWNIQTQSYESVPNLSYGLTWNQLLLP